MICTNCGNKGTPLKKKKFNTGFIILVICTLFFLPAILTGPASTSIIILFIIAVILFIMIRTKSIVKYIDTYQCPKCGKHTMIPENSRLGKAIKPRTGTNYNDGFSKLNAYTKKVETLPFNFQENATNENIASLRKYLHETPEKIKGERLENHVASALHNKYLYDMANNLNHLVLNDLLLWNGQASTQIDHVIIFPWGLLVIEDKNFSGWIFGNEEDKYWTRVFFKEKDRFYNPIKQNATHIKILKQVLSNYHTRYKHLYYESLIVFSEECKLKTETKTKVIQRSDLEYFLNNYYKKLHSKMLIPEEDRVQIFSYLQNKNERGIDRKLMHLKYIRERYKN
jgi:hypothetical protein